MDTNEDDYELYSNAVTAGETWGELAGGTVVRTHGPAVCDGERCALHNPSDHPLVDAPMVFRADRGFLIERTCDHGVGHPDPDSVAYLTRVSSDGGWGVHGCDGCCQRQ